MQEQIFAEGVVFYNLKCKAEGRIWMAKPRRDMFDWYYSSNIEIIGYSRQGTGEIEDQEKFD